MKATVVYTVLAFFLLYGGLAPWLSGGRDGSDGRWSLVAYAVVYAVAAAVLFLRLVRRGKLRLDPWLLWPVAYVVLAAVTTAWSDLPMLSARRVVALAGAMVFTCWLASTWDGRRTMRMVALALGVIAVLSAVLLLVAPQIAVHGGASAHAGDWRGALYHKNLLGREMAFGALLALAFGVGTLGIFRRLSWWALGGLMAFLVIGAGSATGLILFAVGVYALMLMAWPAFGGMERASRRVVRSVLAALAVAAVVFGAEPVLQALGRDATLTGRDRIWSLSIEQIVAKPLGHGYGAFWEGPQGAAVSARLGYDVGHAHNSLLEVGLELGLPGIVLVLVLVVGAVVVVARDRRPWFRSSRAMVALLLVYVGVVGVSDAILTGPNSPTLVLLLAAILMRDRRLPGTVPADRKR